MATLGILILLLISVFGPLFLWGVYIYQEDRKLRDRGYVGEDAECYFGRVQYLLACIGTGFAVGLYAAFFIDPAPGAQSFSPVFAALGCLGPITLRLRSLRMSLWWLAAYSPMVLLGTAILIAPFSQKLAEIISSFSSFLMVPASLVILALQLFLLFAPSKRSPRELLPPPAPRPKPRASIGKIWVNDNGQKYGPYSLPDILVMGDSGHFGGEALYWHEKLSSWKPLADDLPALREMV